MGLKTFQALAAMLMYPSEELQRAADELSDVIESEKLVAKDDLKALEVLLDGIRNKDLMDLQEEYVLLFDRTRSLSLHLFEHVHGQSRDRGQAMVDLQRQYLDAGVELKSSELPDYLPMFLEYLSLLPLKEAKSQLSLCLPIMSALQSRLLSRDSSYAAAFGALSTIAGAKPDPDMLKALLAREMDDPHDKDALDAEWAESPVTFRPESALPEPGAPAEIPIRIANEQPSR